MLLGESTLPKREKNAQVEDPYGREKALQQDWHRQNQAGPGEDAAHPNFEVAEGETQAGPDPAGFRWRLQEGSAHDSLRLIAALSPDGEALQGPRERVARAPDWWTVLSPINREIRLD